MVRTMFKRTATESLDLEGLAKTHYDALWRFCYRRIGESGASDAVQETFEIALKRAPSFRGQSDPKTWLFGIAVNVCRSSARKHTRETGMEWIEFALSHCPSEAVLNRTLLAKALAGLSEPHREVVLLHEIDGFTYDEIARLLDVPEGTVKSRLHHAFIALRSGMATEEASL